MELSVRSAVDKGPFLVVTPRHLRTTYDLFLLEGVLLGCWKRMVVSLEFIVGHFENLNLYVCSCQILESILRSIVFQIYPLTLTLHRDQIEVFKKSNGYENIDSNILLLYIF